MKNTLKKLGKNLTILVAGAAFFVSTASAQDTTTFSVGKFLSAEGQKGATDIGSYMIRLINFLSTLIGAVAFLAIVIGGITLLTSGGSETQVTKGKDIIKYAVIGLVVALAAYFITAFVQSIFYEYGK